MINLVDSDDREKNFSENFVIISSRKTDFLREFIDKIKFENKETITPVHIREMVHVVASLDPLLFVSPNEIKEGHLFLETQMEELDREKIGEELARRLDNLFK